MSPERIRELAPLLPDNVPFFNNITQYHGRVLSRSTKIAAAQDDPRFPWLFVKTFFDLRQPLPDCVHEIEMIRATEYLWTQQDDLIESVMVLLEPINRVKLTLIDAHLINRDITLKETSQFLGITPDTIATYAGLFFNVRDRLEDQLFMQKLIFPNTRVATLLPDYFVNEHPRHLILRASYNGNIDVARTLAGCRSNMLGDHDAQQSMKAYEGRVFSEARLVSNAGGLGSRKLGVLQTARQLVSASKLSGQEQLSNDSRAGLTAVSMKYEMNEMIKSSQRTAIQKRLAATASDLQKNQAAAAAKKV